MTIQKRKKLYWLFKIASIIVSCALPIWAVCERFPLWTECHGSGHTISVGVILIAVILLIVFRRAVFDFIKDRFNLKHTPPLAVWVALLIVSYILIYIGDVMRDMTAVFWMGFIGCAIGTFLTYIAEKFNDKKV